MNKLQKEIWQTVQEMNRKWTSEGKAEELKNYFHEDMVAITPSDAKRVEGRDNCVRGWKNFSDKAEIHFWEEDDPSIQVYGDDRFAIVTYYFKLSFSMNGQKIDMGGRDMFSLVSEDGKWWVVADQYSQFPTI